MRLENDISNANNPKDDPLVALFNTKLTVMDALDLTQREFIGTEAEKNLAIRKLVLELKKLDKQIQAITLGDDRDIDSENKIILNKAKAEEDKLTRLLAVGNAYNKMKGNIYDNFLGTDEEKEAIMAELGEKDPVIERLKAIAEDKRIYIIIFSNGRI